MTVRPAATADCRWIVEQLEDRRQKRVAEAPVFWRPAPDAVIQHRTYIQHLLIDGAARICRTDGSVLVAVPRGAGWLVDDVALHNEDWSGEGRDLWNAFAMECGGSPVRFVCPAFEASRGAFAVAASLQISETWWLLELPDSGGGDADIQVRVSGAQAMTVAAPPVYRPPGPILLLHHVTEAASAIAAAVEQAPRLGCAAIVVSVPPGSEDVPSLLTAAGFRRHCDFYSGIIRRV